MTFKVFRNVTSESELTLWNLTTQGDHTKLPQWAHNYINGLADYGREFGFGDRTSCYHSEVVNKWICVGGWTIPLMEDFVNAEAGLSEAADKVHASADRYTKAVLKLRSEVKNDVASIAAMSSKSVSEIAKLDEAISKLQANMLSPEMITAIANAERLAAALQAISAVQSNSITFAVLDKKTAT